MFSCISLAGQHPDRVLMPNRLRPFIYILFLTYEIQHTSKNLRRSSLSSPLYNVSLKFDKKKNQLFIAKVGSFWSVRGTFQERSRLINWFLHP